MSAVQGALEARHDIPEYTSTNPLGGDPLTEDVNIYYNVSLERPSQRGEVVD